MNVIECISRKRSIRIYKEKVISKETIKELITLGTKASTGSGEEPWGFVVIRDKEEINSLSESTKEHILNNMDKYPYLKQYEDWLRNPNYSVFNGSNTLLIVYGNTQSHWYIYDCSLAAGNIMLAAYSMNIGTCWIGFAEYILNTKEFKKKYNIPEYFDLVCPMSIGYIKDSFELEPPRRKEPIIFNNF